VSDASDTMGTIRALAVARGEHLADLLHGPTGSSPIASELRASVDTFDSILEACDAWTAKQPVRVPRIGA